MIMTRKCRMCDNFVFVPSLVVRMFHRQAALQARRSRWGRQSVRRCRAISRTGASDQQEGEYPPAVSQLEKGALAAGAKRVARLGANGRRDTGGPNSLELAGRRAGYRGCYMLLPAPIVPPQACGCAQFISRNFSRLANGQVELGSAARCRRPQRMGDLS